MDYCQSETAKTSWLRGGPGRRILSQPRPEDLLPVDVHGETVFQKYDGPNGETPSRAPKNKTRRPQRPLLPPSVTDGAESLFLPSPEAGADVAQISNISLPRRCLPS